METDSVMPGRAAKVLKAISRYSGEEEKSIDFDHLLI